MQSSFRDMGVKLNVFCIEFGVYVTLTCSLVNKQTNVSHSSYHTLNEQAQ